VTRAKEARASRAPLRGVILTALRRGARVLIFAAAAAGAVDAASAIVIVVVVVGRIRLSPERLLLVVCPGVARREKNPVSSALAAAW